MEDVNAWMLEMKPYDAKVFRFQTVRTEQPIADTRTRAHAICSQNEARATVTVMCDGEKLIKRSSSLSEQKGSSKTANCMNNKCRTKAFAFAVVAVGVIVCVLLFR